MIEGDATHPVGPGNKIIVHICNDKGYWGGGFTGSLSVRWLRPQIAYQHYKCLHAEDEDLELGGWYSLSMWTMTSGLPTLSDSTELDVALCHPFGITLFAKAYDGSREWLVKLELRFTCRKLVVAWRVAIGM